MVVRGVRAHAAGRVETSARGEARAWQGRYPRAIAGAAIRRLGADAARTNFLRARHFRLSHEKHCSIARLGLPSAEVCALVGCRGGTAPFLKKSAIPGSFL